MSLTRISTLSQQARAAKEAAVKKKRMSHLVTALFAVVIIMCGLGLAKPGLFDVDEAIFAQASVEMLHTHNFVTPTYNGAPRYDKPPMIYYLQAASMHEFGVSPFAARLPSAVCAFILLFMFFNSLEILTGERRYALIATGVLAFNLSFMVLAHAAIADMLLNLLMLSVTMLLLGNIYAKNPSGMRVVIAGFLMGAGLLTKGPVAVVIPGFVVGSIALLKDYRKYNIAAVAPVSLTLSAVLAIVPWCKMMIDAHGMAFFKTFILVHNIGRYFHGLGVSEVKPGAWWYYIVVLLVGFTPWVLLLPSAIRGVLPDFIRRIRGHNARESLPALGLVWLVGVVVIFSFSATKLPHYIVPALPGAALLVADRIDRLPKEGISLWHLLYIVPLGALLPLVVFALPYLPDVLLGQGPYAQWLLAHHVHGIPVKDPMVMGILAQAVNFGIYPILVASTIFVGIVVGFFLMRRRMIEGAVIWMCAMAVAIGLVMAGIVPKVYDYTQQPLAWLAQQIDANYNPKTDTVVYYRAHLPSVRFISGIPFVPVDEAQVAARWPGRTLFIMATAKHVGELKPYLWGHVDKRCVGGYCLLTVNGRQQHP